MIKIIAEDLFYFNLVIFINICLETLAGFAETRDGKRSRVGGRSSWLLGKARRSQGSGQRKDYVDGFVERNEALFKQQKKIYNQTKKKNKLNKFSRTRFIAKNRTQFP